MPPVLSLQIKSRQRVRDLAEVYTHDREVSAMLDLVSGMFPSGDDPKNIGRTFLEPACGSGNFLVEILRRKLTYVGRPSFKSVNTVEAATLRALSSVYGIDIDQSNVDASRRILRVEVEHHMNAELNTESLTDRFFTAVDVILTTNIIRADTLMDARTIPLVEYHWQRKAGYVIREWSFLEEPDTGGQLDLFFDGDSEPRKDAVAIHYGLLDDNPKPTRMMQAAKHHGGKR